MCKLKLLSIIVLLWIQAGTFSYTVSAQALIKGSIELDTSVWAPVAYLSLIPDFTQMHTMSYEIIIERVPIDENGNFNFNTEILPEEDHLYRIHFSKIDYPPASLIIGGRDENHFFFIANKFARVEVNSFEGLGLINDLSFSGYQANNSLQEINEISDYLDTLDYYSANLNREFISLAVEEELRSFADTCSNPLVSLYALSNSSYESDYLVNPEFYRSYLKKWRKENSEYFEVFRSQLPIEETNNKILSLLLLIGILLLPIGLFVFRRYNKTGDKPYKSLTVQERRVFSLLKQGMTNKDISEECGISISTVKSHVNKIYSKLNVNSRKEVMDFGQ